MNSLLQRLSETGSSVLPFARDVVVQSSILILVLLAAEFLLRRHLRPSVRHALWLLVPIKLLLPPSLALPTGIAWWLPIQPSERAVDSRGWTVRHGSEAGVEPGLGDSVPRAVSFGTRTRLPIWPAAALLLWASGSSIVFAELVRRTIQLRRIAAESTAAPDELLHVLDSAREQLGLRGNVSLRLVDGGQSPAVFGLFVPTVLMPRGLVASLGPGQCRAILLHELIHARRGDVWFHVFQTLLLTVWWWHPLLWVAHARLRAAREESVDDAVAYELGTESDEYPAALLAVARAALERPHLGLGFVGILESRGALRTRIERLLADPPAVRPRLSGTGLLLTILAALALLPMSRARTSPAIAGTVPDASAPGTGTITVAQVSTTSTPDRAWDETARFLRERIAAKERQLEGLLARHEAKWPDVLESQAELIEIRSRLEEHEIAYQRDPDLAERFEKARQRYKEASRAMQAHLQSIEELAARGLLPTSFDATSDPVAARLGAEVRAARDEHAAISDRRAPFTRERQILVEAHFLWVSEPAFPALGLPFGVLTNQLLDPAILPDVLRAARSHRGIRILGSPRIQTRSAVPASIALSDAGFPAAGATRLELAVVAAPGAGYGRIGLAVRADITECVDPGQSTEGSRTVASGTPAPVPGATVNATNALGYVSRHLSNSVALPNGAVLVLTDRGSAASAVPGRPAADAVRHAVVLVKATTN